MYSQKNIFVLVPLASLPQQDDITSHIQKLLQVSQQSIQVLELAANKYAVNIRDLEINFLEIQQLVKDQRMLQSKIKLYEQVLENYRPEQTSKQIYGQIANIDSLIKKAKKSKQLKQQNKKLKKLLQLQLQNTEKVREETQKTMRTLKGEFDALVQEMNGKQIKQNGKNSKKQVRDKQPKNISPHIKKQLHFDI